MSNEDVETDERGADRDWAMYRDVADIGRADLYEALLKSAGFAEDPILVMQASQLCLIDNLLNGVEHEVMIRRFDGAPPRGKGRAAAVPFADVNIRRRRVAADMASALR